MSIDSHDSSVTILREIDLGMHHLFIMSDQSIDLLADEQTPYVADNMLSLDACQTYRLMICLQEVFKQERVYLPQHQRLEQARQRHTTAQQPLGSAILQEA